MGKSAAIDVEGFEDLQERLNRYSPVVGPTDDVEVFLAGFDAIEDAVEQKGVVVKGS